MLMLLKPLITDYTLAEHFYSNIISIYNYKLYLTGFNMEGTKQLYLANKWPVISFPEQQLTADSLYFPLGLYPSFPPSFRHSMTKQ